MIKLLARIIRICRWKLVSDVVMFCCVVLFNDCKTVLSIYLTDPVVGKENAMYNVICFSNNRIGFIYVTYLTILWSFSVKTLKACLCLWSLCRLSKLWSLHVDRTCDSCVYQFYFDYLLRNFLCSSSLFICFMYTLKLLSL